MVAHSGVESVSYLQQERDNVLETAIIHFKTTRGAWLRVHGIVIGHFWVGSALRWLQIVYVGICVAQHSLRF